MEASRGRVLVHADVHDGELPVARDVDADVEALLRGLRHCARFDEIREIALRLDLLDVVGRAQAAGARAAVVEYALGEGLLRARAGADVLPEEFAVLGVLRGNDLLVGEDILIVRSAEGLGVDGASGGGWCLGWWMEPRGVRVPCSTGRWDTYPRRASGRHRARRRLRSPRRGGS